MARKALTKLPAETEGELQDKIMQLSRIRGWRRVHFRPAHTGKGWRTAFTGDAGFPDLVLVRPGNLIGRMNRVIFAELKQDGKEPTEEQLAWLTALRDAGAEVYVWRPRDWHEIERILQ